MAPGSCAPSTALWLRVMVVKSSYRTLMVTVLANSAFFASHFATSRAIPSTS
jgi:hypothetical protein